MLTGMRWEDWLRLLGQRRGRAHPREWPMLARLSLQSLLNEGLYRLEESQLSERIEAERPAAPLIVLGFWRSGTSWLHQLLAQDPGLAFPTPLQVFNPHTFFFWEGRLQAPRLHRLMQAVNLWFWGRPAERWQRPGDNLPAGLDLPEEDEVALSMFGLSPRVRTYLSRLPEVYERYFTLRELEPDQRRRWKSEWRRFLQKLSLFHGHRPLVLKSPHHTARLRTLLEVVPQARFVHIRRHPWEVYRSTVRFLEARQQRLRFADPAPDFSQRCISMYQQVYSAYLEDRGSVPPGQLHELRYEDLQRDPLGQLERTYQALSLANFPERQMRAYLDSLGGYRRGQYAPLDAATRASLARAWGPFFEAFGYSAEEL